MCRIGLDEKYTSEAPPPASLMDGRVGRSGQRFRTVANATPTAQYGLAHGLSPKVPPQAGRKSARVPTPARSHEARKRRAVSRNRSRRRFEPIEANGDLTRGTRRTNGCRCCRPVAIVGTVHLCLSVYNGRRWSGGPMQGPGRPLDLGSRGTNRQAILATTGGTKRRPIPDYSCRRPAARHRLAMTNKWH